MGLNFLFEERNVFVDERLERFERLKKIREEKIAAESIFNEVTDPDAIDFAIHMINAVERKEELLRKEVR